MARKGKVWVLAGEIRAQGTYILLDQTFLGETKHTAYSKASKGVPYAPLTLECGREMEGRM